MMMNYPEETYAQMERLTIRILMMIVEETGASLQDAMEEFYPSRTCERLYLYETGYYHESASYLYNLFKLDIKFHRSYVIDSNKFSPV